MKVNLRLIAFILAASIVLVTASFNSAQKNENKQAASRSTGKPGKWVAQYRSPASLAYSGSNLAVFSYSGISVVSPNVVFVCGDTPNPRGGEERVGVIVRTTDGGQSWTDTAIELPGIHIPTLNAIHFVNPNVGWAVGVDSGADGIVIKTTDGGASWGFTRLAQKQTPISVFFTDADNGFIGGSTELPGDEGSIGGPSAILVTTDGGQNWQTRYTVPHSILRVQFVDNMTGWASATRGVIYNTTDGGRTWDKQRTEIELGDGPIDLKGEGVKQFAIHSIQFIDKVHGFAAASATEQQAGRMLVTSNGGASWHRYFLQAEDGIRDVFFITPNEGWALTEQGPYVNYTVDGGRSWLSEPKVFEQDVPFLRLAAADPNHVWAAGGGAIFFRVTE
jgi:photosystem II stability/assembly factor-like uncharacterized protein